jgi:serine/threonine protein phosphatase PrpC
LDAHGSSGREVSETLSNFVQKTIENNFKILLKKDRDENIKKYLRNMVLKGEDHLKQNNIDLKYSGSSMNNLLIMKNKIFIINIGNSKSVFYREQNEKKFAIELSNAHVPENKEERYRIYKNGGIVQRYNENGVDIWPLRIWDKKIENGPGIQITRSIGNTQATSLGVINELEIQKFDLIRNDYFIICANNSFWELIYSTEACYYVQKFNQVYKNFFDKCGDFLLKKACKNGLKIHLLYYNSNFTFEDIIVILIKKDKKNNLNNEIII